MSISIKHGWVSRLVVRSTHQQKQEQMPVSPASVRSFWGSFESMVRAWVRAWVRVWVSIISMGEYSSRLVVRS